jgi:hypothetical protein
MSRGKHSVHEGTCPDREIFRTLALKWDLIKWIKAWWNPKGHYDLQLGSKGFFTIIFFNLEDKDQIFENGPYFFNFSRLILKILDGLLQP